MTTFFLPNPADYSRDFDKLWEVNEFTVETGATVTLNLYESDGDHPYCMSITSDTDAKGCYIDITGITAAIKYRVKWSYKCGAGQELDYVIHDLTGAADIETGTLTDTWWGAFYTEITSPAGCTTIRIYLRAGTSAGTAIYIDGIAVQGNAIQTTDPTLIMNNRVKATRHNMDGGRVVIDQGLLFVDMSLSWELLSQADYEKLQEVVKSVSATFFDDTDVPAITERAEMYLEGEYDFTGISNPSADHIGWESKSASEPAAAADFEDTELLTAEYNVLDDDDSNGVTDSASVTGHYQYQKFRFNCSDEFSAFADIKALDVIYKGASNDASTANQDGVKLLLWNVNASNWVEVAASWSADKETLRFSTTRPEIAQMFVDVTNGYVYALIQSHNTKAATFALSVTSYYIQVKVNPEMDTDLTLLNEAILDTDCDIIWAKNLTENRLMALWPDYRIGDDRQSVIVDGVFATLDGAATHFSGGDNLDAAANDFTISAWIRRDGNPATNEIIVEKYGGVGYSFFIDTSGQLGAYIEDAGGSVTISDGDVVTDGEWHHVVARFDRSGNVTRFIDGVETGTATDISAISGDISNAANFIVGANSAGATQWFEGSICHLRIQIGGTLMSNAQIAWEYAHGRDYSSQSWTLDGTRSYWKFDDAASAANADGDGMITDGSGTGNHLDAVGGTTTNYGTHSRALAADGGDDVEVKYNQYYKVKGMNLKGAKILADVEPSFASPSMSLEPQIGMK